jgi:hypothetical protein
LRKARTEEFAYVIRAETQLQLMALSPLHQFTFFNSHFAISFPGIGTVNNLSTQSDFNAVPHIVRLACVPTLSLFNKLNANPATHPRPRVANWQHQHVA